MTNTTTLNTYRKREWERIRHAHEDITSEQKNKSMNVQIKAEPNKVKNLQLLLQSQWEGVSQHKQRQQQQLTGVLASTATSNSNNSQVFWPAQPQATATTHRCFGQHSHKQQQQLTGVLASTATSNSNNSQVFWPAQPQATATTHRCFGQHSHKGAGVSREAASQVVQRSSHNILAVGRGVRLWVAAPAQEGQTCYRWFYATPCPQYLLPTFFSEKGTTSIFFSFLLPTNLKKVQYMISIFLLLSSNLAFWSKFLYRTAPKKHTHLHDDTQRKKNTSAFDPWFSSGVRKQSKEEGRKVEDRQEVEAKQFSTEISIDKDRSHILYLF